MIRIRFADDHTILRPGPRQLLIDEPAWRSLARPRIQARPIRCANLESPSGALVGLARDGRPGVPAELWPNRRGIGRGFQ